MKRLKKAAAGLTAFLSVCCLLPQILGFSSVYAAEAVPAAECRPYTATGEPNSIPSSGSRIRIVDNSDPIYGTYIAYCLEATKRYPEIGSHVRYCWYDDSASDGEIVLQTMDNPRGGADDALWHLKTTLWNGYPLNYDYLKEHFDVTEEEAEWITQMTVHYWSDSWYTITGNPNQYDDGPRANKEFRQRDAQRKAAGRPLLWDLFNFLVEKGNTPDTQEPPREPSFDCQWLIGIPQGNENFGYQRIVALQPNQHEMDILKTDENGIPLEGAEFHFEKTDMPSHSAHIVDGALENYVADWNTTDMNPFKTFPPAGTYRLTETKTPDGYDPIPEIIVTITEQGQFLVAQDQAGTHVQADGNTLKVANHKIYTPPTPTVSFAKIAEGAQPNPNGSIAQLEGAWLKVVQGADKNGYELPGGSNWFSNGTPKSFQMLPGIYTFAEISAPGGYQKADPIVFQVSQNGKIQIRQPDDSFGPELEDLTITMVDPVTSYEVQFQKQDVNGNMLTGATIQILDFTTKQEVAKWQSDGTLWNVNLKPGQYIFHEEHPPTGYKSVGDITFTVAVDGKVTIDSKRPQDFVEVEGRNKLVVTDQEEPGDVTVKKTVTGKGADSNQYFRFVMQVQDQKDQSAVSGAFPLLIGNPGDAADHQGQDSTMDLAKKVLTFNGNGQAVFYLKHGQSLTVNMPKQTLVKVEEFHDGSYTTNHQIVGADPLKADQPEKASFILDTEHPSVEVDYENHRETIVPTGIQLNQVILFPIFFGTLLTAAVMLLVSLFRLHRKKPRKVRHCHEK